MDWKDYFSAHGPYLAEHPTYFTRERLETELEFLVRHVPLAKGDRILDLACGQARHTIALTKQGYTVIGVDRSNHLLTLGRQAADEQDVTVTLVEQDMLKLDLEQTFDVILILFAAFGIEDDDNNRRILERVHRHLEVGGRVFMEIHNVFRMARQFIDTSATNFTFDAATLTLWDKSPTGPELPYRYYTIPELRKLMASVGLALDKTWGSYLGESYGLSSERLLVLAHRKR